MNKSPQKISYNIDLVKSVFKSNQKSLIQISEQNIELIKIQNENFIKRLSKSTNPNKNENFESLAEESSHLDNIDWIFLNSIFISAFSHFEIQLYKIANITEDFINNIKIKDISGKGIFQYRKFLEIIALLESSKKDNKWNEIDNYQKVRNKLVHNGGIIITDPSKKNNLEKDTVYKFLKSKEVPVYGSLGLIRIKNIDFIKNFSDLVINISDNLIEEIKVKY